MTAPGRQDRLGIGMLSVFGLPPIELVDLAAELGCRYVSVAVQGTGDLDVLAELGVPRTFSSGSAAEDPPRDRSRR